MLTSKTMRKVLFSVLVSLMFSLISCAGGFMSVSNNQPCSEVGTFVQFSKVMSESFAPNYIGCDITTEAQFVATGKGAWYTPSLDKKGYVVIRCLPPGQQGQKNPLSGEIQSNFVMVPEKYSDAIFSANVGDILELRGGTTVKKQFPAGITEVVFFATSAKKK